MPSFLKDEIERAFRAIYWDEEVNDWEQVVHDVGLTSALDLFTVGYEHGAHERVAEPPKRRSVVDVSQDIVQAYFPGEKASGEFIDMVVEEIELSHIADAKNSEPEVTTVLRRLALCIHGLLSPQSASRQEIATVVGFLTEVLP